MATINRFGTSVLLVGSLALASLMLYTLLLADGRATNRLIALDVADVAIVFPEQNSTGWEEFRRGVLSCRDLVLISEVVETRDTLTVRTADGHRIRFRWTPASGLVQTRSVVRELLDRPVPPVAVVGSENTALTAVLARALRDSSAGAASAGPVLLVPWATAIVAEPESPGQEPIPLLEIYPGRTFRFCPDNQRQADLLVRFAHDQAAPRSPSRVVVVSDANDPFSRDLALAFREALQDILPRTLVDDRAALPIPAMPSTAPDARESRWAAEVWGQARAGTERGPCWLVLTLQGEPSRRLLTALAALAPSDAESIPLHVLSGDGIGVTTLDGLAGTLPFPVWVASAGFVSGERPAPSQGSQVMAEIVLALARARDATPAGGDLADSLRALEVPSKALGRSIAFGPSGERRGEDLGQVLTIAPGSDRILARTQRSDGAWAGALAVATERP